MLGRAPRRANRGNQKEAKKRMNKYQFLSEREFTNADS
jgi:hypothetical protein